MEALSLATRGSGRGLPPAVAAAVAAADSLRLCDSIRAAALEVPTCRRDCRTLSRFVGKVMLVMEALHAAMEQQQAAARAAAATAAAAGSSSGTAQPPISADVAFGSPLPEAFLVPADQQQAQPPLLPPDALLVAWAEAAGDVRGALSAVADLVAACGSMGRLQAVLEAEEMRGRFAAAARDLGQALMGLHALRPIAPADVAEDAATAQRQLAALRFSPSSQQETLAGALLRAAALQRVWRRSGGELAPLLLEALALAGLDMAAEAAKGQAWPEPPNWLEFEVRRMCDGAAAAAAAGDAVTEFFYLQVTLSLLAVICGAWSPERQLAAASNAASSLSIVANGGADGAENVRQQQPQQSQQQPQAQALVGGKAVQQGQGLLARRLQQHLAAWAHIGSSGAGSGDVLVSLGGQEAPPLPASSLAVLDRLTEDTLALLLSAVRQQGSHSLVHIDPADPSSVVDALAGPSELSQFTAALLIEERVEGGTDGERAALAKLDAVPKLMAVLQGTRQPALRTTIATALRHWARDSTMRQALASAGVIPALILLLQCSSSSARQAAARAISNIVVHTEANKIEAAKFGAIHCLARMLEVHEAPLLQEAAAAALANLAANSGEAQSLIASAGAIPLLVEVLRCGTLPAKQHAARAIRNLAGRDTQNKLRMAEAGAIPLLVALMAGGGDGDRATRQAAASALSNIACNCEETQRQIVTEGALPVLCELMLPSCPCGAACREAAAWTLSNLACSAEVRAELGKDPAVLEGVVAGLVELLQSRSDSAGQAAARAIKNMSAGHHNSSKGMIAAAGVVPLLVDLLRSPKDQSRKAAASALWNLAYRNNPNRKAIVLAGAIPLLVQLLRPESSEGCRQEAARALSNLSCNNEVNQGNQMVEEGAVPLLVGMMESAGPTGKEAAVGAISNLACIKGHQQAILEAGAAPLLLQLLQPGASSGCQEAAARGFGNLVCDSLSDTLRPVAYQAIPLLVRVMSSGSEGARQAAARAISNLVCSDVTIQVMVAKSGAAPALLELCKSPGEDLREAAAVALWDLAYDCSLGREAIARAGAVPWLAQLLLFGGQGAKEAAAACLAELAAVGPVVQQQIRDAGTVSLLQNLQSSSVPEVALAATEALRSLEVNSSRDSSRASSTSHTTASGTVSGTISNTAASSSATAAAAAAAAAAADEPSLARQSGGSSSGAATFAKSSSFGRRSAQALSLEQVPPELADAEAVGASVAVNSPPRAAHLLPPRPTGLPSPRISPRAALQ